MSGARYAIYYAPPEDSPLARFGDAWLGRSAAGRPLATRPEGAGLDGIDLDAITESPRHYGFHGTLKPPFALAEGRGEADLIAALDAFAAGVRRFDLPPLRCAALGSFIALVPGSDCAELSWLAGACVETFDPFRAPPSDGELAGRRANGLGERQEAMLVRWGYPYVFEEFRFHLTLTGRLDPPVRDRVRAALADLTAPLRADPVPVGDLALFRQPDRTTPFRIVERFEFTR